MKKEDDAHAVQGSFTDFNVWDKVLTVQEMKDFTLCHYDMKGSLIPWNSEDWVFTEEIDASEYELGEVEFSKLCSMKGRLEMFPDKVIISTALNTCKIFGGTMVVTEEDKDYDELLELMNQYDTVQTWLRFSDKENDGEWKDMETGLIQPFLSIPWDLENEPTGASAESCVGFQTTTHLGAFDVDCTQKLTTVCQETKEYFRLRGLCPSSSIDTFYKLRQQHNNGRKMLSGPSGWVIVWKENKWNILNKGHPGTFAFLSTRLYPVGKHGWVVVGDGCSIEERNSMELTLTHCKEDQFTCDLGTCVDMEQRCDQEDNCEDHSDEKDCSIIYVDQDSYLKDKQPPAVDSNENKIVTVEVEVDIIRILQINEVCQYNFFEICFCLLKLNSFNPYFGCPGWEHL